MEVLRVILFAQHLAGGHKVEQWIQHQAEEVHHPEVELQPLGEDHRVAMLLQHLKEDLQTATKLPLHNSKNRNQLEILV